MGKMNGLYKADFPKGTIVRITNRENLELFLERWKFHNKLSPAQLDYAGQLATVESVGFYHGGDELYVLEDVPGVWHEQCLEMT